MKISYNWLKQLIKFDASPIKLADDLTNAGLSVESVYKINGDHILDLEITANRGDCLSVIGIAREIVALYGILDTNIYPEIKFKDEKINKNINVNISTKELVPRYSALIIEGVKVKTSPDWIKKRLQSYGFHPKNNIVDITNYIMIETGQPLHAFDYEKINNGNINIHLSKKGDNLITLDGKDRTLDENSIIIDDGKKIYDLAGIMGGYNSEVDEKTRTIILESSIFDPINIRKTSKRLNMQTDASYRYERGVDINGTIFAIQRAADLIKLTCPNAKIGSVIDVKNVEENNGYIKVDTEKINKLLGTKINDEKIYNYLFRLGFCKDGENNRVSIPSYRAYDVHIWQDLAEEVGRLYGYNKLENTYLKQNKSKINKKFIKKETIKDLLNSNGFTEIYSYTFVDEKLLKLLDYDLKKCIQVTNPIAPENKYLRPDLLPSILSAFAKNPWAPEMNIFEIGKVFDNGIEKFQLSLAVSGKDNTKITKIIKTFNIRPDIKSIDQKILDTIKIRKQIRYIILDLDEINYNVLKYITKFPKIDCKNISDFPPTIRDLAFIVGKTIDANLVKLDIEKLDDHILLVELFDEFVSDKFGKDMKNIAYHIWLQDLNMPLGKKESDKIINKIINKIEIKYKARLR